jgi:SAM-dependent methyltransferase
MIPRDNQSLRYGAVSAWLPNDAPFSFLDYGCGLGHQNRYFIENGIKNVEYTGVDINPEFLKFCSNSYPNSSFLSRGDFLLATDEYDYVSFIGTFNLVYSEETDHEQFVFAELRELWNSTRRAILMNFMSTAVDYVQAGAHHQNLGSLYEFVANNLSRKIFVDSRFLPYEYLLVAER